jgi:hypothetical protein
MKPRWSYLATYRNRCRWLCFRGALCALLVVSVGCSSDCRDRTGTSVSGELASGSTPSLADGGDVSDRVEADIPNFWNTDGPVMAVAEDDERVYIGGRFDHVFPYRGNLLTVDPRSAERRDDFPLVHGLVRTAVSDGAGGFYVGGDFRNVDDQAHQGLVRIDGTGKVDPSFSVTLNGPVSTLFLDGDTLYVAGAFDRVGDASRRHVAAVDGRTGAVRAWKAEVGGPVVAIAATDEVIYLGGAFSRVGEARRHSLAAVSKDTGEVTDWEPVVEGNVHALAVVDGTLYVGGVFSRVNASPRHHLAAFETGSGALRDWQPRMGGDGAAVDTLVLADQVLYVGGAFTTADGTARERLAAFEVPAGKLLDFNPGADGRVLAMAVAGETLNVGGEFTTLGGKSLSRLGQIHRSTGEARSLNLDIDGQNQTRVLAMAASSDVVVIGGDFGMSGAVARRNLAAFDKKTGAVVDWSPEPDGAVNAVERVGDALYVGGAFQTIAGAERPHIARLNAADASVDPWSVRVNGEVYGLTLDEDTVYVTGDFRMVGSAPRRYIAAIDRVSAEVRPFDARADGPVVSVAMDGEVLYIGGGFQEIGGAPQAYLAAVDKTTGLARDDWEPRIGRGSASWIEFLGVSALAVADDVIYAGGVFGQVGQETRWSLAAIDKKNGAVTSWNPMVHGTVMSMALSNDLLYVSGDFGRVGGQNRPALAAVDRRSGRATYWNPMATPWVGHLKVSEDRVYAAGALVYLDGQLRQGFGAIAASTSHVTPAEARPTGDFSWEDAVAGGPEIAVKALGHYTAYQGCVPSMRLPGMTPESRQFWLTGAPFCYFEEPAEPHHPDYRIRAIMYSEDRPVVVQLEPTGTMAFDRTAVERLNLPAMPHVHRRPGAPLAPAGRNVLSYRADAVEPADGIVLGYDLFAKPQAPGELGFVRIYVSNGWPAIMALVEVEGVPAVSEQMVLPASTSLMSPRSGAGGYVEFSLDTLRMGREPVYPGLKREQATPAELTSMEQQRFFGAPDQRKQAVSTMLENVRAEAARWGNEREGWLDVAADQTSSATVLTGLFEIFAAEGIDDFGLRGRYVQTLSQPFTAYASVNRVDLEFAPTVRSAPTRDWAPSRIRLTATLSPRGIDLRGLGPAIKPLDGCPADGPAICLRDGSVDVRALIERARQAQRAGRFDEATTLVAQAVAAYDWARFHNLLLMIKDQYADESTLHFIAEADVAVAVVVRAMDVSRYRLRGGMGENACAQSFASVSALEASRPCVQPGQREPDYVPLFNRHVWSWGF